MVLLILIVRQAKKHHIELLGVFVQIGLVPNTDWLGGTLERNRLVKSSLINMVLQMFLVYLLQVTVQIVRYKQIIISMGSGATAALGAFDYLIRN